MRARGSIGLSLLTLCLALTALTSLAGAAPRDAGRLHEFRLTASNGFEIEVRGAPRTRGEPARVYLRAERGPATVTYEPEGTVTDRRLVAEFGALGRIDVEFRPDGRERRVRPSCGGPPIRFDGGVFAGTIEFSGEEGFASVVASEAPVVPDLEELCWGVEEARGAGKGVVLEVIGEGYGVTVIENRPGARTWLGLGVYEEAGDVRIDRELIGTLPTSAFDWSADLRRATLTPTASALSGFAWFQARGRRATSWKGDLRADFPGRPDTLVAGGPVLTSIEHGFLRYHRIRR